MKNKNFRLEKNTTYSRVILAMLMGMDDRAMRAEVRAQRRAGIPIVSIKGGGYKIAETDQEKLHLLRQYRTRAMDELVTYYKLLKSMQVDGQISVEDIIAEAMI